MKAVTELLKLGSNFLVIVNFSVEYNSDFAVVGDDRLVTALQINYFEARCAHREDARAVHSALVRPAVRERRGGLFDALRVGSPVLMRESRYSAQLTTPFRCLPLLLDFSPSVIPIAPRGKLLAAAYIPYPSATSATPRHTSSTPDHLAKLISSPRIYFAPNVPTT